MPERLPRAGVPKSVATNRLSLVHSRNSIAYQGTTPCSRPSPRIRTI
jgi:hypothetical protein